MHNGLYLALAVNTVQAIGTEIPLALVSLTERRDSQLRRGAMDYSNWSCQVVPPAGPPADGKR